MQPKLVINGETAIHGIRGGGWKFNCGAVALNIMLEATELGLASVCVGDFDREKPRVMRTLEMLSDDIKAGII